MDILKIEGEVARPCELTRADLGAFDAAARIDDLKSIGVDRPGSAVRLRSLVDRVGPNDAVRYITFHAPRDDFHATAPLDRIVDEGVLIYTLDGEALPENQGGPFRFLIPNPAACKTDEIDECLNVKYVESITLSAKKGRDTRPRDEDEHAALHRSEDAS